MFTDINYQIVPEEATFERIFLSGNTVSFQSLFVKNTVPPHITKDCSHLRGNIKSHKKLQDMLQIDNLA